MEAKEEYRVDTNIIQKQKQIYNNYGLDTQLDKLEEECLELILAIKHKNRVLGIGNIIEEMADVLNLIEQIKDNNEYIEKGIKRNIEYKVNRELERINRR